MILQVGWIVPPGLTTILAVGAHALPNFFARPEDSLLRSYFREYEFRRCPHSTELAHVQMGLVPIHFEIGVGTRQA
jgi:hypothetical protein